MIEFIKKKNFLLSLILLFLVLLYIININDSKIHNNKNSLITTQLINEKNKLLIKQIKISQNDSSIILSKGSFFWVIYDEQNTKNILPIENSTINNFLDELTKLRQIELVSSKLQNNNNFGFNSEHSIKIEYFLEDSTKYELLFGNKDFSKTFRYFMSSNSLKVYKIDSSLEDYLSVLVQNWAEPYIFSKAVLTYTDEKDIQTCKINYNNKLYSLDNSNTKEFYTKMSKLLQLRHGGLNSTNKTLEAEFTLILEFGNKKWSQIQISKNQDTQNDYTLLITDYDEINQKKYQFCSKISLWTYNRIKEITL